MSDDEWLEVTVRDMVKNGLIERPMDGNHGEIHPKSQDFVAAGVPFVMASDLGHGTVDLINCQKITEQQAKKLRKGFSRTGDVLLSHKATMGRTAIVPLLQSEYIVLTPQVTYYRVRDEDRLNNRYLKYYFDSQPFQEVLEAWSNAGSTRAYLSITSQLDLPVLLPPIETQREIARVLGALDDKIELNRRLNATLEGLARAVFRSWFVDFDPVVAKAAGRRPVGMTADTAALFPDAFADSPLGPIPRGWEVRPIGELVEVVGGSTPRTEEPLYWNVGTHNWATPRDLANLADPVLTTTDRKITTLGLQQISSGLLPVGTVLLSSRAPIGYLALATIPVAVNQGFIALKCNRMLPNLYALHWARENMDAVLERANGTTFLEISKSNFRPIPALQPPAPVLQAFMRHSKPLYGRLVANVQQSTTLAALRDALLPRLLSGELRLKDAERAVGEVA